MSDKKVIKISTDEITKIKKLRDDSQEIRIKMGEIELQIYEIEIVSKELNTEKSNLLTKHEEIKKQSKSLMVELEKKYGVGDINVETGEFVSK